MRTTSLFRLLEPSEVQAELLRLRTLQHYSIRNTKIRSLKRLRPAASLSLWRSIAYSRDFPDALKKCLTSHYRTVLPTMYCTIKSHKVTQGTLAEKSIEEVKVRPIVSCVGSPTEKLGLELLL